MCEKRNLGKFDNFCKSKPEIMCTRTGYCCLKLDDNEILGLFKEYVYRYRYRVFSKCYCLFVSSDRSPYIDSVLVEI